MLHLRSSLQCSIVDSPSTGATGYIGGQTLHAIASTIPSSQVSVACLVRSAERGKLVQNAYPEHVRIVMGDLDDVGIIEKECQKSQVVLRQLPRPPLSLSLPCFQLT